MRYLLLVLTAITLVTCKPTEPAVNSEPAVPFTWDNATIYFMMTDRFHNGDKGNDHVHADDAPPAPYRGFMGGDVKGITQKIKEGYFNDLGVDAIWMTPLVEQIQGSVDEGTGTSYPFHGYWTRDWTAIDSRFGTAVEVKEMVQTAHEHGIRILMDAVANHTGPVTEQSPIWPVDWVRTGPQCTYENAETTISCTLVKNLPDILTDSEQEVDLPPFLVDKWKSEGRYEQEVAELDEFFTKTGYRRTAVNYIIKWLVDLIKDYGIDGYRVDTVKHTEAEVWTALYKAATEAYALMQKEQPDMVLPDNEFYMVGEVYNYYIGNGRLYNYNDTVVDFYDNAFHALINFDLKGSDGMTYEEVYTKYDNILHNGGMATKSVVNYMSSHDDGSPYDKDRSKPLEAMTRLLLAPGAAQIYYGDETARSLSVEADGDAVLRSFMNWDELATDAPRGEYSVKQVLEHTQKLAKFRQRHPAVGAGRHFMTTSSPYLFIREYTNGDFQDLVLIGLDLPAEVIDITVGPTVADGEVVRDAYSGAVVTVAEGKVSFTPQGGVLLLEVM